MATLVSGLYCGFIQVGTRHDLYMNVSGTISRSGTTVTLSDLSCYLYMNSGSVTYGSSDGRTWGLKNPSGGANTTWVSYGGTWSNRSFALSNMSFDIPVTDTSCTMYVTGPDGDFAWTLSGIPAGTTPPTGLAISNIVATTDSISATVSVTGWGIGTGTKYRRLSVCTAQSTTNRKYATAEGETLSSNLTVDNSSTGNITITPNSRYYVTMSASNGQASTGSTSFTEKVTLAPALTSATVTNIEPKSATINVNTAADGGFYTKTIEYSLDGQTWLTGATVASGEASSANFNLANLSPATSYTVQLRVSTTAGVTNCDPVSFSTRGTFYGSVDGVSKATVTMYGSVLGKTKRIAKFYGSVNGVSKRIM